MAQRYTSSGNSYFWQTAEQRGKYFKEHLQLGDYYSQENIVASEWAGIGTEQLGLTGRVKQDQFLKPCHNQNPQTGELLMQCPQMLTVTWDKIPV